ncbi:MULTISPECIES: acyl-CoA dehydrogenase family protein [Streptomyces]|uniref:Acyl-[acyl-carrier-protein] dehydrogenase MbtN n=1 Tax=Streptomyces doudnae TaxID=3075536 RepID=A0ABD5EV70_9ACTN|nr:MULTISPECIES: acyl-CoA dehydrogenase family protein [unclassified Streptomyces]MDT0438631.1 acyl-CoA dehydrogenase family protein [Streptomyces sp. DSM 41981]MYQ69057.1 acyl-CoA dehydrogenase [Streptomyces sp. SID4950]SCE51090.1 acyl-CoA dehydrogenase/long-chain-acyl-CoA dehydrogenase [Streptomyces sp. SolWspMP-5a-2]
MRRTLYGPEHHAFADTLQDFLTKKVVPHLTEWEEKGAVPRSLYRDVASLGALGLQVPTEYGGGGAKSFLFNCVLTEQVAYSRATLGSLRVHTDVVMPYVMAYATPEQRERWLPGMADGTLMSAIAMSEPGAGSDLAGMATTARHTAQGWVVSGSKTFITGGSQADIVVVVARTSRSENRRGGLSLLVVEDGMKGFQRGRLLKKLGLMTQDTSELFFDDVLVPHDNMLGEEGRAFEYLTGNLAQERLSIAVNAQAQSVTALDITTAYVKERRVFDKALSSFQNTKFTLADLDTRVAAGQALLDRAIADHEEGALSAADAARVKLYCTETQGLVVDACLQLHGGYGYIREYDICRLYADARVTRIYGGTSEVMKTIIAKSLGL